MFSGRYPHTLDAKGRVAVPRGFRDSLGGTNQGRVIVTISLDEDKSYLDIYPADKWEGIITDALENGFNDFGPLDASDAREAFLHHYVHSAQQQQLDGQGRILIPAEHRDAANLSKNVIFTGDVKKFRLWAVDEWEKADTKACGDKAMIRARANKWL
jgi:MraZ protein